MHPQQHCMAAIHTRFPTHFPDIVGGLQEAFDLRPRVMIRPMDVQSYSAIRSRK